MNSFVTVALACLAVASASPSGLWLAGPSVGVVPKWNQWGDVGPSGIVTGAGASGPSGVVTGAGTAGPAGVVTGHGAIGPNGVPSSLRDDAIVAPALGVAPLGLGVARVGLGVAPLGVASLGVPAAALGIAAAPLRLGVAPVKVASVGLGGTTIVGPSASSVVVGPSVGLGLGHGVVRHW